MSFEHPTHADSESRTKIAEVREKVKGHLTKKKSVAFPVWGFYIAMAIGMIGLIFGGIQQLRMARYIKLITSSKTVVRELSSRLEVAKLEAIRELAGKQHVINAGELKRIDESIKVSQAKKEAIEKRAGRLDPGQLLEAFKEEGF